MTGDGRGPGDSPAGPDDDINSRLADIAAELAADAKFREPSAAERTRLLAGQPLPARSRPGPLRRLRNRRTAALLRKPVESASGPRTPAPRRTRFRGPAAGSGPRPVLGRRLVRRPAAAGRLRPVPDRGYATPSHRTPRQSLGILVAAIVILIAACALVVALAHHP